VAVWPAGLPKYPLQDGFSFAEPNGLISSPMDQGPPKVRRRFTATLARCQCSWKLTEAQLAILRGFVIDDLAGGALSFTWWYPLSTVELECSARFGPEGLPVYSPAGARWLATAEVWILP
jgi:hypothetical protein